MIRGGLSDAPRLFCAFPVDFVDAEGKVLAESGTMGEGKTEEGEIVVVPDGAVALRIDTGQRVQGAPNTKDGGGL